MEPDAGTIRLGSKVQIGYYDQEHHVLHPDKTLFEEISDEYPSLNNTEIRNTLAAFLFTGDDAFKRIKRPFRRRARTCFPRKAHAFRIELPDPRRADEPSGHRLQGNSGGCVKQLQRNGFICFHDRYFINRTAHRILELSGGTLHQYLGNYDYYLEKNPNRALLQSPQPSAL